MDRRAGRLLPGSACQFFQGLTARLTWAVRAVTRDQHARVESEYDALRIPSAGAHLWTWFWELEQGRRSGFGPEAFTYVDIEAWARLLGEEPRPWEIRLLMAMDAARRAEHGRLNDPSRTGAVEANDTAGLIAMMRGLRGR